MGIIKSMSNGPKTTDSATQSNNSVASERAQSGVSKKWVIGMALGSAAGAVLLVSSIASTSAEAPVLADGAHLVQTGNKVEKKPAAKPKKSEKNSENENSDTKSDSVVYKPARQSVTVSTNSVPQPAQTPKYGKNASSNSKVASKVKKPSAKPNMTDGEPAGGAPVEGPINHSE